MGKYTKRAIDRMKSAKDITSRPVTNQERVPMNNPEDGAINTLGVYGPYETPIKRAKKKKKPRYKRMP